MSVQYFFNKKLILHISSSCFSELYDNMIEIIEKLNIKLNDNLKNLMEDLYHGAGGFGLDFKDYIKNKTDALIFSRLVTESIEKFEKEYPDLPYDTKERLWNFHKELLKYADELEK